MLRRAMMAQPTGGGGSGWDAAVAALPNLWGWWKLDETAGNGVSASDSSGNARHGTYTAAGTQTTGLVSGSTAAQATFGGRVTLPNFTTQATPQFSVGAIIKTTHNTASEQQILSGDNGTPNRMYQFNKSTSGHKLSFVTISPSVTTTTAATAINDGNPHLAIAVFDQSLAAADGRVKLYLDGVLDGASTTAITITSALACGLGIASRAGASGFGLWAGAMDEPFFCSGAISAADVAALWAARNT